MFESYKIILCKKISNCAALNHVWSECYFDTVFRVYTTFFKYGIAAQNISMAPGYTHRDLPLFLQSPIDLLYTGSQSALSLAPSTLFSSSLGIPYQPSYILNYPVSKFSAYMSISLCNIVQTTPPTLYQYPLFCKIWCNLPSSYDLPRIYTIWYFFQVNSVFVYFF